MGGPSYCATVFERLKKLSSGFRAWRNWRFRRTGWRNGASEGGGKHRRAQPTQSRRRTCCILYGASLARRSRDRHYTPNPGRVRFGLSVSALSGRSFWGKGGDEGSPARDCHRRSGWIGEEYGGKTGWGEGGLRGCG